MRGLAALLILVCVGGLVLMGKGIYGLTMFLAIPFLLGVIGAWWKGVRTGSAGAGVGALAGLGACLLPLLLGLEGAICVVMSIPLAAPLGALGGLVYHWVANSRLPKNSVAALMLLPAGTLGFDITASPPLFEVKTAIEIAAPLETVWKHVVTFAELPAPDEWFFKVGLAYPMRARIEGTGVGAVRYCEFSTGPFVEPIDTWQEPTLLQFRVTENPAPMHEWSPYAQVFPKHLHGYMISKKGQFHLTPLPGGRTRLEGTTWYQHGLWPAAYWRLWSDAIIHRIHLRVLNHISNLATAATSPIPPTAHNSAHQRASLEPGSRDRSAE